MEFLRAVALACSLAACARHVALDDAPCPCGEGWQCCDGACVPATDLCAADVALRAVESWRDHPSLVAWYSATGLPGVAQAPTLQSGAEVTVWYDLAPGAHADDMAIGGTAPTIGDEADGPVLRFPSNASLVNDEVMPADAAKTAVMLMRFAAGSMTSRILLRLGADVADGYVNLQTGGDAQIEVRRPVGPDYAFSGCPWSQVVGQWLVLAWAYNGADGLQDHARYIDGLRLTGCDSETRPVGGSGARLEMLFDASDVREVLLFDTVLSGVDVAEVSRVVAERY